MRVHSASLRAPTADDDTDDVQAALEAPPDLVVALNAGWPCQTRVGADAAAVRRRANALLLHRLLRVQRRVGRCARGALLGALSVGVDLNCSAAQTAA